MALLQLCKVNTNYAGRTAAATRRLVFLFPPRSCGGSSGFQPNAQRSRYGSPSTKVQPSLPHSASLGF